MLALMTKVLIQSDILNLGLPVGKEAYIIAQNRRVNVAYQYLVRVPSTKKEYWVVAQDIRAFNEADTSLDYSGEAKAVLIDVALQTKNYDIIRCLLNEKKSDNHQ
jgi:hypothetical protein